MSAKHTKGPWEVVTNAPGAAEPSVMADGYFIATVHGMGNGSATETLANARLIAAAPDLLEACQAFIEWRVADLTEQQRDGAFYAAQAAIAKAEGK